MSTAEGAALRRVVEGYGRSALADPVALRSALRAVGGGLPADRVAVLAAVAGAGAAGELGRSTGSPDVPDAVVEAVRGRCGLPVEDVRTACESFAAALEPAPVAVRAGGGDPPRLEWEGTAAGERTAAPAPRAPRWPVLVVSVAAAVALAVLLGVVVWTGGASPAAAPADPYALDQVAQRYRALGADLVTGALRCAPVSPQPGETERVRCDFGVLSIQLVSYDSDGRLQAARDAALTPAPDSGRSASADQGGAAFIMDQRLSGPARLYWDAAAPRPVSAEVQGGDRPLAELVSFYDQRRSTAVSRPEQPGPAFASPRLWELASTFVTAGRAQCTPTAPKDVFPQVIEQIDCTFPGGVLAEFCLLPDDRSFTYYRTNTASPDDVVPGSLRLSAWTDVGAAEDQDAQLAEYRLAADGRSYLYFDRRDLLAFGRFYSPDWDQDRLKAFFLARANP